MTRFFANVPLVWLNLSHDPRRMALSMSGIAFAVLLLFMQTGFRNAMLDGQVELVRMLNADLVVANRAKETLFVSTPFPRRRLQQARQGRAVADAYGVYIENFGFNWKNVLNLTTRPIRTIAFNPKDPVFLDPGIRAASRLLEQPDTVVFDDHSRPYYGSPGIGTATELGRRKVRVVGSFRLGADFTNDGNLLTSDATFMNLASGLNDPVDRISQVELGLVKLAPGADARQARDDLARLLPDDVRVFTKAEFMAFEEGFWRETTPIGMIFDLGTAVGFIVGVVIGYQIIYTSVTNNLKQYATLKAIGYDDKFLVGVVAREGWMLALLGFVPGLLISVVCYQVMATFGNLLMRMTLSRVGMIFAMTVGMCLISAMITIRKVVSSDPAEVFG